MRITCPSCASHFELPSELLGKKGRALKCATCQHAWYQAAQVESLDLASVMGDDYAAQAANAQAARSAQQQAAQQRGTAGGIQRVPPVQQNAAQNARNLLAGAVGVVQQQRNAPLGAPRDPSRNVQAAPLRQQPHTPPLGAPPVPPGAVSMMSRRNQYQRQNQGPGQQPSTAQSWFAGTSRAPGAQQQQPPGASGAPGVPPQAAAVLAGQPARNQPPSPNAPGQGAVSWMQQPGAQPPMPQVAPLGMAGAHGGPGAAPLPGQSMRGQAGSAPAPGEAAVSWMNPQGQPLPGMPGGMQGPMAGMPAGATGGPGQPPPGAMPGVMPGVMPGPMSGAMPGAMPPGAYPQVMTGALGPPISPAQAQAAALAGQSMRGQAGSAPAPGEAAVSWMNPQGQIVPPGTPGAIPVAMPGAPGMLGAPGQSIRQHGVPAGPGEAAVSWMKPGAQDAPGGPGQSMMNQALPAGPGAAAVSQISNEIVAPGQGARSLLDGSHIAHTGQLMQGASGGPGQPAQSMLDPAVTAGASGTPNAPGAGPGAQPAQPPAQPAVDPGVSGGPGAGPQAAAAPTGANEPFGEAGTSDGPSAGPAKKTEAEADAGASGGPGAKSAAAVAAALGAEADDELVDPDADRPNFGSTAEEDDAEDVEEQPDDAFSLIAARAGGEQGGSTAPVKIRKPIDPAYVTAMMMTGIVASILAVLWFARAELAKLMPQFQSLYDRVGVEAPRPGDGLSIAESSKRLQRIGGVETLVVRGYVANIGDIPRAVPGLRLELYNEKKEVIQAETANASVGLLDPAKSAEFEIRLELPQLNLAKGGYAVVWNTQ